MIPIVVIGIGSPYGADQLGWRVIELLQREPDMQTFLPDRIVLHRCGRPGTGLLEYMRNSQLTILVDAVQAGTTPGTVIRLDGEYIEPQAPELSSHGLGIAAALALGRALGELPDQIIILGLEIGTDTDHLPDEGIQKRLTQSVVTEVQSFFQPS